ncbi:MAG: phosphatidylserine decarboxylase [Halieaceae bacterium]|nr:phosphatidylserine decarboxylase [Halieaceae bacterium]
MDKIFIFLQHILPQHLLSRWVGWLARLEHPVWLKNWLVHVFIRHFGVNMAEAADPDPTRYPSFNAFFTRPLREGARPLAQADILCPADGAISQLGAIEGGRIFQAKGQSFSAWELLGGDTERAPLFDGGRFATIYLSPRDYHRVHMPLAGRLTASRYIPGDLYSVNQVTAANVPRLFARNERLVCHFDTEVGPMAMVLVGAMIVASVDTVWAGQVCPGRSACADHRYEDHAPAIQIGKGEEMGRFKLGSTVIALFGPGMANLEGLFSPGDSVRMGQRIGVLSCETAAAEEQSAAD